MLTLISQLALPEKRIETAKKIAVDLGVEDVLIFIRDDELGVLLPAPGFPQTLLKASELRNFLATCSNSGIHATTTTHPFTGKITTVSALVHEGKLAIIFIGGRPKIQQLSPLRQLLPLLTSLFYLEQYTEQAKVHTHQAEAAATEHRNIASKLDSTRRNLQAALREKDAEIQERIKSQTALAESEQRFRFMAESLQAMIFTADASGELNYISPQWERYTGRSLDSLRGTGMSAVLHPEDQQQVVEHWLSSYKAGTSIEQEVRIRRADGKYRWHLSRSQAMRNEAGEIIMWVGSSTDIEEVRLNMQKKLELEEKTALLTRQQDNLIELSAAKDEFIRLASHQLRTPATGVKMYIGMLMGGYADEPTENQMRMLDQAYQSNDRQLQIIDDLLKVATIDAGKVILNKERSDLTELINEVVEELKHTVSRRQQIIVFNAPEKAIHATIDKRYIRMVIENIIDNASKYSPDNSTITVCLRENDLKEIAITDQGVGIAKKDQAYLFKKFSRIHNDMSVSAAGTGIGLYWAKEIITLHDGTITLASRPRQGSTFTILLP